MEVIVTKQFGKDVEKELDKTHQLQLADVIEQLKEAKSLHEISYLIKLTGYKTAYCIKLGMYRIGFLFLKKIKSS